MSGSSERLWGLLPALYRLRDAERGEPLRALLAVMEEELRTLEEDIEQLGENWFIETCAEWVVPYIGELVGSRPLVEAAHSRRTDVAKTIYYRRRKGTLPMLEELARDVTGWGARAVEFMESLAWTQHLNHLRWTPAPDSGLRHPAAVDRVGTVNVRSMDALDRLGGPFDLAAHTVDVRRSPVGMIARGRTARPSQVQGRYGTRKVGFFVWRLGSYPMAGVPARRAAAPNEHGWNFSPLGAPAPLFTDTRAERDPARLAEEIHLPGPIRPLAFRTDVEDYRARYLPLPPDERPAESTWYGPNRSFHIVADGVPVAPESLLCKDLGAWARPPAGRVAVDVRRGRIAFALGEEPEEVEVSFAYGFAADLGGGPYDRRGTVVEETEVAWHRRVAKGTALETLSGALAEWAADGKPHGAITIGDSRAYEEALDAALPAAGRLVVQAEEGQRPTLRLAGEWTVSAPAAGGRLTLNGLVIEGGMELAGSPTVEILHCTLVPGRGLEETGEPVAPGEPSLLAADGATPEMILSHSIVGPIRLPATARALGVRDSIVQAFPADGEARPAIAGDAAMTAPGPATTLERTTVFGPAFVRELALASEVLFTAPVVAQRKQAGCVRFSYLAEGSETPRRFRCQPDLALQGVADPAEQARIRARLAPSFASQRYGDPAYAQLSLGCAEEIRTGAASGAEMGAYATLMQPQREANLRTRLDEYLPFGLEAGLIYVI